MALTVSLLPTDQVRIDPLVTRMPPNLAELRWLGDHHPKGKDRE
jgi:hypothetical protein